MGLGNTSDVQVMIGVPPKFLVVLRACPGPTGPANVPPGLRHRHNGPGSPGPLIGPLEGHPELPMLLEKIESKYFLKNFSINTNIRTTSIFHFASTTITNTLKRFSRSKILD